MAQSPRLAGAGKLYGSALAGLLRDDGKGSGPLPNRRGIWPYALEVFRFVIGKMPNLRVIACLGVEPWELATEVREEGISVIAMAHPSRPNGGASMVNEDWNAIENSLLGE